MAVAKYQVLKLFEIKGYKPMLGAELVLNDVDGTRLVEIGKVRLLRYLDPEDTADAAIIEKGQALLSPSASDISEVEKQDLPEDRADKAKEDAEVKGGEPVPDAPAADEPEKPVKVTKKKTK